MAKFERSRDALGLFFACLCLFILGLQRQEIIGFESRFYLFVLEMLRHGPSWFPTTYGQYYPDYPATSTFFIYLCAKLFGSVDKTVAVLPSAIAAAITVSVTYLIGALQNRKTGLLAAFFVLLTNTFVMEARSISPDMYVTMATALAFYCAYSAEISQKNCRLVWLPILLLFGFACRGPIGFIVPAGVISVFYILENNLKKFFLFGVMSAILLAVSVGLFLMLARSVGGDQFALSVWQMEVSGRLDNAVLPWYFYFTESFGAYALSFPLAFLAVLGMGSKLFVKKPSQEAQFILKLIGWVLVILVGLSIPAGKKIRYLLPMAPALGLLCATLFSFEFNNVYLNSLRKLVRFFCVLFPILSIGVIVYLHEVLAQRGLDVPMIYGIAITVLALLQVLSWLGRREETQVIGVAAITFMMMAIFVITPVNLYLNRARGFAFKVELYRVHEHAALYFYHEQPDALPIKYMLYQQDESMPVFLQNADDFKNVTGKNVVVTSKEYYAQLPEEILRKTQVLFTGDLGREPMVVFSLIP